MFWCAVLHASSVAGRQLTAASRAPGPRADGSRRQHQGMHCAGARRQGALGARAALGRGSGRPALHRLQHAVGGSCASGDRAVTQCRQQARSLEQLNESVPFSQTFSPPLYTDPCLPRGFPFSFADPMCPSQIPGFCQHLFFSLRHGASLAGAMCCPQSPRHRLQCARLPHQPQVPAVPHRRCGEALPASRAATRCAAMRAPEDIRPGGPGSRRRCSSSSNRGSEDHHSCCVPRAHGYFCEFPASICAMAHHYSKGTAEVGSKHTVAAEVVLIGTGQGW